MVVFPAPLAPRISPWADDLPVARASPRGRRRHVPSSDRRRRRSLAAAERPPAPAPRAAALSATARAATAASSRRDPAGEPAGAAAGTPAGRSGRVGRRGAHSHAPAASAAGPRGRARAPGEPGGGPPRATRTTAARGRRFSTPELPGRRRCTLRPIAARRRRGRARRRSGGRRRSRQITSSSPLPPLGGQLELDRHPLTGRCRQEQIRVVQALAARPGPTAEPHPEALDRRRRQLAGPSASVVRAHPSLGDHSRSGPKAPSRAASHSQARPDVVDVAAQVELAGAGSSLPIARSPAR